MAPAPGVHTLRFLTRFSENLMNRASALSAASAVLLALTASGCDTSQTPCNQSCPDISGVFSIEETTPTGNCGFSPYLLTPSVRIEQSRQGRQATLHLIDPTTELEVPLSGDVYGPGPGDSNLLGSFRIDSRTTRLARRDSTELVTLTVSAAGTVSLVGGRRLLAATLTTTDAMSTSACTATLSVTGESLE